MQLKINKQIATIAFALTAALSGQTQAAPSGPGQEFSSGYEIGFLTAVAEEHKSEVCAQQATMSQLAIALQNYSRGNPEKQKLNVANALAALKSQFPCKQ